MSKKFNNKTCGECQWYDYHHLLCVVGGDVSPTDCVCDSFIPVKLSNGDVIRQMSNEELATWGMYDLGTCPTFEKRQTCPKRGECSASEVEDCWRAWLNAPAKINTESEG